MIVAGFYGYGSLGDELIRQGMARLFGNCRAVGLMNLPPAESITEPVVIGGGSIIGLGIAMSPQFADWILALQVPYAIFGVTLNSYYQAQPLGDGRKLHAILTGARAVYFTNSLSVDLARRHFPEIPAQVGGYAAVAAIDRERGAGDYTVVNFRHPAWFGFYGLERGWFTAQARGVLRLAHNPIGVAFDHQDQEFLTSLGVQSTMPNPTSLVELIAGAKAVIGMRLHACVPALALDVPCLILAYENKCRQLAGSIGSDHVDLRCSPDWAADAAACRPHQGYAACLDRDFITVQAQVVKSGLGLGGT